VTPPLFLLDELPDSDVLDLIGDEGRHAARVKRVGVGEQVFVSDGVGTLMTCSVVATLPDGLRLHVLSRRVVAMPEPRLVVVQALPKGERAELAVEVLTELGVDEIVPWAAARSIARWQGARGERSLEKWRRAAREAAKQSRRARVPVVRALATTADVSAVLAAAACGLVLHEDATEPMPSMVLPGSGDIVVVVGPEGGIAPDELDAFGAAGAVAARLGDTVLRTSTAGAAALAALSLRLGRWGK
jgi:16S rRNA (uracil1498-N3)-methyltransferase